MDRLNEAIDREVHALFVRNEPYSEASHAAAKECARLQSLHEKAFDNVYRTALDRATKDWYALMDARSRHWRANAGSVDALLLLRDMREFVDVLPLGAWHGPQS